MNQPIIGMIGLGMMGTPMANNLLKANYIIHGFDLHLGAKEKLSHFANFHWQSSAKEVALSSDVIILMLPDSKIIDELLWGQLQDGIVFDCKPHTIFLDMSSSNPSNSKNNAEKLKALGHEFIDAPVSGGVKRAIDGSLAIMVGGEKTSVENMMPILQAMGKTIIHVGSSGAGHAVKALNNYVSASGLLAVSEALVAAQAFGIDPHLANQVFNASTGKNNTTDVKVENFMLSGTFNSGFAIALMRKDIQTAKDFIDDMKTSGGFASTCLEHWSAAEQGLEKGADHTAMFKFVKNQPKE